jgi:hypothetical protein
MSARLRMPMTYRCTRELMRRCRGRISDRDGSIRPVVPPFTIVGARTCRGSEEATYSRGRLAIVMKGACVRRPSISFLMNCLRALLPCCDGSSLCGTRHWWELRPCTCRSYTETDGPWSRSAGGYRPADAQARAWPMINPRRIARFAVVREPVHDVYVS